jgi:hypothetical protein
LLAADFSHQFAGRVRHGMHRHVAFELVDKIPPALAEFRRGGAVDTMHQVGNCSTVCFFRSA